MQAHLPLNSPSYGKLLATHRPWWVKQLVISILVSAICIIGSWFYLQTAVLSQWTSWIGLLIPLSILGLLWFAFMRRYTRRVFLYEGALVDKRGSSLRAYRWDQVDQVSAYRTQFNMLAPILFGALGSLMSHKVSTYQTQTSGVATTECRIRYRNGRKLTFATTDASSSRERGMNDALPALTEYELIGAILELASPHALEHAITQYQAGKRLDFKRFQISSQGIHAGRATLAWMQVEDIYSDGTQLVIKAIGQQRSWREFQIADIPNREILPNLLSTTQNRSFSAFTTANTQMGSEAEVRAMRAAYRHSTWKKWLTGIAVMIMIIVARIGIGVYSYMTSAEYHVEQSDSLFNAGDYPGALEEMNQAIAIEPQNADNYASRCFIYRELAQLDQAFTDCRQALTLEPDNPYALVNLARVYHRQQNYQQALNIYEKALFTYPRYDYIYCSRAYTYKRMGMHKEAITDFSTCHTLTTDEWWKTESDKQINELMKGNQALQNQE